MDDREYYSTIEAAKLLNMSRIAVVKRIYSGTLKAERVGRSYAIPKAEIALTFKRARRRRVPMAPST